MPGDTEYVETSNQEASHKVAVRLKMKPYIIQFSYELQQIWGGSKKTKLKENMKGEMK